MPPKQRALKWLIPITSNHQDTTSVLLWRDTNTLGLSQSGSYCHLHIGNAFFFFLFSSEPTSEGTAVFTVLYSESRRVTWQTLWEQQVSALIKIYKKKKKVIKKSHKNTQMKKTCCATEVFCRSAGAELRPGSFLLFLKSPTWIRR